jgi:hypothetical protein
MVFFVCCPEQAALNGDSRSGTDGAPARVECRSLPEVQLS